MNRTRVALLLLLGYFILTAGECESSSSFLIGSDDVTVIDDVLFVVTATHSSYSGLEARGTVKNVGDQTIESGWYIEGQFYSDSTLSLKFGGSRTWVKIPLEPGTSTLWKLSYSSNLVAEEDFPRFAVAQLRAYYENE